MLIPILSWYLTLQLFAAAGWPLAFSWLRRLPSRGYAASKALGLLLSGAVFWWGGIVRLWDNTTGGILLSAGLVAALGLWLLRGRRAEAREWLREHRGMVLVTELLFAGALVLWALVRASQPQLQTAGGEKWMEIAFLNAILRSPTLPPHDPWLSGYAISYYYLGYLLLGMVTRVSGVVSTVAFNLGGAGWFAMAATVAYGVVYDLLERRDALRPLLAPLLLLLVGNAQGFCEVLHARGLLWPGFWRWLDLIHLSDAPTAPFSWTPTRFFWWWQASRTLRDYAPDGTPILIIDEFPAFSFTLGDMHPHVLALPFVLLIVALALDIYRRRDLPALTWTRPGLARRLAPLAGSAVLLGALGFLNTWDFPIYWALVVGALALAYLRQLTAADETLGGWRLFEALSSLLPDAVALGVLSVLCYFPFWWALRSQAGGVLPNLFHATRLPHFAVMFLPLLLPSAGVIVTAARATRLRWEQIALAGFGLLVGIALAGWLVGLPSALPYLRAVLRGEAIQGIAWPPALIRQAFFDRLLNPWTALLLATGVGVSLLALFTRESPLPEGVGFPLLLTLIGLLLTLGPEFVYLRDVFMTRMNTIFKFYFQAWVLWSLAGAWQLARWMRAARVRGGLALWLTVFSVLGLMVGLVYTLFAVPARARENGTPWTLDGAAWLAEAYPDDYAAIHWLNANVEGRHVILEAPGDNHRAYVYEGRISALTGLPTVLGWAGHQRQWRGNYNEPAAREQDISVIYSTPHPAEALALLQRYAVEYIYVGRVERAAYPPEGLIKFEAMFPRVYHQQGVSIYRVEP